MLDFYIGTKGERAAALRRLSSEIETLAKRGDRGVRITIKAARPPKTWSQLKIFHGYIVPAFVEAQKEAGDIVSVEAQKEILKRRFLLWPIIEKDGSPMIDRETGEAFYYVPSLAELTVAQMSEFIEKCIFEYGERYGREI